MKKYILPMTLIISLAGNVYLFRTTVNWQKAWLAQMLTTSDIETIFIKSGADISFLTLKQTAENEYSGEFKELVNEAPDISASKKTISLGQTELYFENGIFIGSKAKLPNNAPYWNFANEF